MQRYAAEGHLRLSLPTCTEIIFKSIYYTVLSFGKGKSENLGLMKFCRNLNHLHVKNLLFIENIPFFFQALEITYISPDISKRVK